ncbi:MAG: type II secretion system F family protein, partial [Bacteroidaceae bacterium]|nr:type II secretion system F family protein [Bacteroidaceae bacterium]
MLLLDDSIILCEDITNCNIGQKISTRDLCLFCRQFVSLQRAGVTIIETLKMLSEATENKFFSKTLTNVCKSVEMGESFA